MVEPPSESREAALTALLKATAGYGSVDGVGGVAKLSCRVKIRGQEPVNAAGKMLGIGVCE